MWPPDKTGGEIVGSVGTAMILSIFSFSGWYFVTHVAGEVRDPARTLPRAIFIGIGVVLVLYLAVNAGYLYALPFDRVKESSRIAADALEALDAILQGVDGATLTAPEAIEQLLGAQIQLRNNRRLQAAMRSSRLPAVKRLTEFDFSFQPTLRREQMESLHELGFVERRENVVFLGPPGVGKTHLAISLAIAAAQSGRVYYGTLADLITSLEEAQAAGRLQVRLQVLTHPALLVVDQIGYLPISRTGAMLFFQLMTRRYEDASTVLTSNKGLRSGARSSATRSWPPPSSTASCTTAIR
jgi:DNA replication protein DnaC